MLWRTGRKEAGCKIQTQESSAHLPPPPHPCFEALEFLISQVLNVFSMFGLNITDTSIIILLLNPTTYLLRGCHHVNW